MENLTRLLPIFAIFAMLFFAFGCVGGDSAKDDSDGSGSDQTAVVQETTDETQDVESSDETSDTGGEESEDEADDKIDMSDLRSQTNIKCTYKLKNSLGETDMYIRDSNNMKVVLKLETGESTFYMEGDDAYIVNPAGDGSFFSMKNAPQPDMYESLEEAQSLAKEGSEDVIYECVPYTVTDEDLARPDIEYRDMNEAMEKMKQMQSS